MYDGLFKTLNLNLINDSIEVSQHVKKEKEREKKGLTHFETWQKNRP